MKQLARLTALLLAVLWLPAAALGHDAAEKLYGTWVANDVDTVLGSVRLKVTFREDGPVSAMAWSTLPLMGKVYSTRGPYHVKNGRIISQSIQGGTSLKYWFDSGDLIVQYSDGKTVRLHRQS